MKDQTTLEKFITSNHQKMIPPATELASILQEIDQNTPWYYKIDFAQFFLVPAMTCTLLIILSWSLFYSNPPSHSAQLTAKFVQESFAIFEDIDDMTI